MSPYWQRHKELLLEQLDNLEPELRAQIMADPTCDEAKRIEADVRAKLEQDNLKP